MTHAPQTPAARAEHRVRALIGDVREAVSVHVFRDTPASVASVAELLAAAPVGLCRDLIEACRVAEEAGHCPLPALSADDRLVLELVRGMYDWGAGSVAPPRD